MINYQKLHLVKANVKGISALPGAEQLFKDWKTISPKTKKVSVVTGPGLKHYISNAVKQAAKNNIELVHFVVKTDKEFLYRTKNLPLDIQGQWILPDNRVLSRKVLKEVLTYNSKEGKQTVVFSPKLLALGGLFYSRISTAEIVDKIYQRLQESVGGSEVPGADVILLSNHEIGINPVVARQLGLEIPAAYKKFLND